LNATPSDLLLRGKTTQWVKTISEELIEFWGKFGNKKDPDLFNIPLLNWSGNSRSFHISGFGDSFFIAGT